MQFTYNRKLKLGKIDCLVPTHSKINLIHFSFSHKFTICVCLCIILLHVHSSLVGFPNISTSWISATYSRRLCECKYMFAGFSSPHSSSSANKECTKIIYDINRHGFVCVCVCICIYIVCSTYVYNKSFCFHFLLCSLLQALIQVDILISAVCVSTLLYISFLLHSGCGLIIVYNGQRRW